MKYRRYRIGLLAVIFTLTLAIQPSWAAPEPEKLTLDDSIALALANNPALKIAESDSEKAEWKLNQARAYSGFSLGYGYTQGRTDQPPSWFNFTAAEWPKTYNFYSHQLKLQLPLYTGGKIENSISLARHGAAAADLGTNATRQQLTLDATTAYFNVLQTRNLANVAGQAVNDLAAHLQNVNNHYDAGTVALSDVLQTEVRLANARNNQIKAQNSYKLARYKLNKIIGLSLHNAAALADEFTFQPYRPTVDDSVAMALTNRPELNQVKLKLVMANDQVKIANSGNLPTVALVAAETWQDTISPATSKNRNSWLIGMNVQFNVFDNGLTRSEIKQAEHEVTAAQEQLRQVTDKITLEVCQAYLSLQEATERIANNQVAVNQAETDYQLAQERYENGVGTNLDVMDAELAMTQARINYIQAVYDGHISRAQLDKAMGVIK